jgi:hypothetical protein
MIFFEMVLWNFGMTGIHSFGLISKITLKPIPYENPTAFALSQLSHADFASCISPGSNTF